MEKAFSIVATLSGTIFRKLLHAGNDTRATISKQIAIFFISRQFRN